MTIINANEIPLGETILCSTTLWCLENRNNRVSYNRVTNQLITPELGNQLGSLSYNLESVYRPTAKPLNELSSAEDFSALLLYVGLSNHSQFGYKGSNSTGDGDIALFYDINQQFIKADFSPLPTQGPDGRFHFTGNFSLDSSVHFILFGAWLGKLNIEEITLS